MHITLHRFLKRIYILVTTAAAFVMTVAPAIIRADILPQADISGQKLQPKATPTLYLRVTAYSSSPDETDDTPFITAAGTRVKNGIVATNAFPFGTKLQIPALFGNRIFTVEDRMNRRMKNVVDVWMPTKSAAITFGVSYANVIIVKDKALSQK